jgi:hypothetical protein
MRWKRVVEEYLINQGNGIREFGLKRRQTYIANDNNLLNLYQNGNNDFPVEYLRAIALHL